MVVKVKKCSICGADIPRGKTRDQLMALGYSGVVLGSPRSMDYRNFVFCPNHQAHEMAARIAMAKAAGKFGNTLKKELPEAP